MLLSHLPPAEAGSLQLTLASVRIWPDDSGPAEALASPAAGGRTEVLTSGILPWQRFLPGTSSTRLRRCAVQTVRSAETEGLSTSVF